jgi:hypothetical protein
MTPIQYLWLGCGAFFVGCWSVTLFLRRRIRFHAVHRASIHFPLSHFECGYLVGQPETFPAGRSWCTDCGRQADVGHSADCPRITGERCPMCEKPKRTAHVCHYCGFAGFVIMFDLKKPSAISSQLSAKSREGRK